MSRILIIAAHPDDEILGCGGTIARLAKEGFKAYTLILGEGVASRDGVRNKKKEIKNLKKQAYKANKIIGVKEVFVYNFPDNRFDTVPLLDIIKVIEKVKKKIKPRIIFTHYKNDLNIDHQITYQAVITATRPIKGETVRTIYSFEVLSSTEWCYPLSFSPNVFFNISKTMDLKLKAMTQYKSELNKLPHPRSQAGIKIIAQSWGLKIGCEFAEPFKLIREVK